MIWRALTNNFGWKLGSLLLAITLWFAIVGEPELVTTRTVPILYKNLPRDLLIGPDALDTVHLELRGPASRLTSTGVMDLAALIDLAGVTGPGERTFTLSDRDFHLPQGVTFLHAVPSQLRLRFARLAGKEIPIQIRISAPPPPGFRLVRQQVTPARLRIAGPESRIALTDTAHTDPIDLSGATHTMDIRVNTFVDDPQVWLESSPIVTVKVTVEKSEK